MRFDNPCLARFFYAAALMFFTLLGWTVAKADCVPASAGLVGWWAGDGNGSNIVGTGHATLQSGAGATAVGRVGQAFSFDGTNGYALVSNSIVLQPTNLTVECWVRFASLDTPGTASAGVQYIVFKQNTRTSSFEGFDLGKSRVGSNDVFRFIVSSAGGQSVSIQSTTLISTGVWYHVAGVRGSNFTQLYVNGVLERQTNVTFPQNYGNTPLYFGTSGQAYWDRKFKGDLDEVTLYNRALSGGEIAAIHAAGVEGKCKGPSSQPTILLNVDFGAGAQTAKIGPAVLGQSTNDFWNFYTRDDGAGGWRSSGALPNLKQANGANSGIGITVINAPGAWNNGSADSMYDGYIYPFDDGNVSVTVTNLPPGDYTFFLYSSDGNFQLTSGAIDYGVKTSVESPVTNPPVWQEGLQYVAFRNVVVPSVVEPVVITVRPGVFGFATISGMQMTHGPAPWISQQPTNLIVSVSSNIVLRVAGGGDPAPSYQWFFGSTALVNGGRINGARSNSLTVANAQVSDAGDYFAVLTNASGSATSAVATVQVGLAPAIVQSPIGQTNVAGGMVQFAASVSGSEPLFYQWYQNGQLLSNDARRSGTTSTNLTITNLTSNDAGGYSIVVTNIFGRSTSAVAHLEVLLPPVLVQQPTSQFGALGSNAIFQITATGTAPLSYQWHLDGNQIGNDARRSGTTSNRLTLSNLQFSDAGSYSVVVTNVAGTITSAVATLAVGNPPQIIQQPQTRTVIIGDPAQLEVTVTGDLPLTYQWYRDGTSVGGATSNKVTFNPAQPFQAGNYTVVVTNNFGTVTSLVATLTVISEPMTLLNVDFGGGSTTDGASGPAAIGQGANDYWNFYNHAGASRSEGGAIVLSMANTNPTTAAINLPGAPGHWGNGSANLMYLTYVYPTFSPSATTMTMTVSNLPAGEYDFYLYANDGKFQLTSALVDHGVKTSLENPVVNPPLWQEGKQYVAFRRVAVTNIAQPVVITVQPGIFGYAIISGMQIAQFPTNPVAPVIWAQPADQYVAVGSNVVLRATGVGLPSPDYRWFRNGAPLVDGASVYGSASNTLTITGAQLTDNGSFFVVLSNSVGSVTSSVVAVQAIENPQPPSIVQSPVSQTNIVGGVAQFSASVSGSEPLSFQWYRNSTPLSDDARRFGATTTNLVITNLVVGDAGNYTLRVASPFGAATTAVATLTIPIPPSMTTQPRGYSVPVGLPVTLAGAASGAAPLRYQWLLNGNPVPNATNSSLTISNLVVANFGNYQLVVTNTGGAITSAVAQLTAGTVGTWGTFSSQTGIPIWPASGLSNVVAVAAGSWYSLALRQDGTVYAWGYNNPATNVPAGLTGVVGIAAGQTHALALLSNGMVRAWGYGPSLTNVPGTLSNVIAVAAGYSHCAALRSDGTVVVWSDFPQGQTNIPPGLMKVAAIDAGESQTLALRDDGRLFSWGGQPSFPVPSDVKNVAGFSGGPAFSALNLALLSNGTVRAWGAFQAATNVPPGLSDIIAVEGAGGDDRSASVALAVRSNRTVVAWRGLGATSLTNVPAGISNVLALAGGASHVLALMDDGRPLIVRPPVGGTFYRGRDLVLKAKVIGNVPLSLQWFKNGNPIPGAVEESLFLPLAPSGDAGSYYLVASNALGVAQSVTVPVTIVDRAPVLMSQPQSRFAYYGSPFSVGASVIGSGPLALTWLQNGVPAHFGTNDLVYDRALSSHGGSYQLVASNSFGSVTSTVAQITFTRVASWGNGPSINPGPFASNAPASLNLGDVVRVAAGDSHVVALRADGTVVSWGQSPSGLAGVPPGLGNVISVGAGLNFSVALRSDGTVAAWGAVNAGQTNVPSGLANVTAIAVDAGHTLALRANGTVVAWGVNSSGQTNVPVNLSNVVAIAAGSVHSLALKSDGTIVGWGTFGKIPNYTNAVAIAAGHGQSLALQADGTVVAWSTGGAATSLPTGLSNVVAIAVGGPGPNNQFQSLALKSDGSMVLWGNNIAAAFNYPPELTSGIAASSGGAYTMLTLGDRSPFTTAQPFSRHAVSGTNVTFAALSVGQPTLNFQWRLNGSDIPGATGPTLTLTNVSRDSRGAYSALVWNAFGSTNSAEAWLDVVGPVRLLPPAISGNHESGLVNFAVGDREGGAMDAGDAGWLEVQASTNLLNWQVLPNALTFTNGTLMLHDPAQNNYPLRFYRLIEH